VQRIRDGVEPDLLRERTESCVENFHVRLRTGYGGAGSCMSDLGLKQLAFELAEFVKQCIRAGAAGAGGVCVEREFCGGGHSFGPQRCGVLLSILLWSVRDGVRSAVIERRTRRVCSSTGLPKTREISWRTDGSDWRKKGL